MLPIRDGLLINLHLKDEALLRMIFAKSVASALVLQMNRRSKEVFENFQEITRVQGLPVFLLFCRGDMKFFAGVDWVSSFRFIESSYLDTVVRISSV